jgi:hypothetical protein
MLLRLIVGYGRRIEPALRDQLLRGLVEVVCAGTGSQALSHFGGEGQDRGERPVVDGDVGSDPARLCGARQPVPPAPGAVAGAARPQPVAGSSPRTTQPRCTGVTYSAVCSTSTDELHERTYAHPRALGITLPAGSGLKRGLALVGWWRYRGGWFRLIGEGPLAPEGPQLVQQPVKASGDGAFHGGNAGAGIGVAAVPSSPEPALALPSRRRRLSSCRAAGAGRRRSDPGRFRLHAKEVYQAAQQDVAHDQSVAEAVQPIGAARDLHTDNLTLASAAVSWAVSHPVSRRRIAPRPHGRRRP